VKHIKEALKSKVGYQGKYVKVYSVDPCFYDSGVQYLQPVYRVLAIPFDPNANATVTPKQFLEYVPIGGDSLESLVPSSKSGPGDGEGGPNEPNSSDNVSRSFLNYFDARKETRAPRPRITVGRYVVRNDNPGFVEDARNFWISLSRSTTIDFIRQGFYWAYPRLYNSDAWFFVNNVNVALTEAHGSFHGFTTYDATSKVDFVNIPSGLAPGGYGPISNSGNGKLGYWFIDACEVMPTIPDFKALGLSDTEAHRRTFDPWWPVFRGGIHAVLTWRTSALFEDNTAATAADRIARFNKPVVYAWLDAAHEDAAYQIRRDYARYEGGPVIWPFGRGVAMFRCGRIADKVTNLENLGAPNCLYVMWWNN
jgi:hypothetical protein